MHLGLFSSIEDGAAARQADFLLVMRSAMPPFEKLTLDEYLAIGKQWGATLGEDECPFEDKASDWGWYDGRRVALDYSTPAWGND
jgi:hypothetical protein